MVWAALAILILCLWAWRYLVSQKASWNNALADLVVLGLVALRFWLGSAAPMYAIPAAPYDDRIFLIQATSLLEGNWLGNFTDLTLVKGPFYSMFFATSSWLGMSLSHAHLLFYAFAAWVVLLAIRQASPRMPIWIQSVGFAVILFCPVMADIGVHVRAWRQPVWVSLCVLVIASSGGLAMSARASQRRKIMWAAILGLSFGAAWLTREEAIWLACPLVVGMGSYAICCWQEKLDWRRAILALSPLLLAPFVVQLVAWKNYREYGFWGIVEMRGTAYVEAYAALARVAPFQWEKRIPVSKAARMNIYEVSPTFASLRDEMEEGIGAIMMQITEGAVGIPASEGEIAGGWMLWTLRTAVQRKGHCKSFADEQAFYRKLADEVNAACDSGKLDCLPRRDTMTPRLDWNVHAKKFGSSLWKALDRSFDYRVGLNPIASVRRQKDIDWVERMAHEEVSSIDPEVAKTQVYPRRHAIWKILVNAYQDWVRPLGMVFSVVLSALFFGGLLRGKVLGLALVGTLGSLGVLCNAAVVALVDVTSWNAIGLNYLGPSLSMGLIAFVAGFVWLATWVHRQVELRLIRSRSLQGAQPQHAEEEARQEDLDSQS